MRSPLRSTSAVTLVCPWAGEETGLTCHTAHSRLGGYVGPERAALSAIARHAHRRLKPPTEEDS
ncbi:unnamed protein product, partial [Nesidiocoris tenuis]